MNVEAYAPLWHKELGNRYNHNTPFPRCLYPQLQNHLNKNDFDLHENGLLFITSLDLTTNEPTKGQK